jgi:CBS domain-containing protein
MSALDDLGIEPKPESVAATATFGEAAERLLASGLPAIAVLDSDRRPVGLFGTDELLRGAFPRYLGELRHTAFTRDDPTRLAETLSLVSDRPVSDFAQSVVVVEDDTSATHLAEVFLHAETTAVAVTRAGRFVGMVASHEFCRAVLGLSAPD